MNSVMKVLLLGVCKDYLAPEPSLPPERPNRGAIHAGCVAVTRALANALSDFCLTLLEFRTKHQVQRRGRGVTAWSARRPLWWRGRTRLRGGVLKQAAVRAVDTAADRMCVCPVASERLVQAGAVAFGGGRIVHRLIAVACRQLVQHPSRDQ